jgi:membrane fusion protein, multidrug efflux system
LERYQEAFASNAIPKQQLDTQVATVHQDEGTVKLDQGLLGQRQSAARLLPHHRADFRTRRFAPGGRGQHRSSQRHESAGRHHQLQPISVIFNVAEDFLPQIQKQLQAGNTLTVDAFDRAQTKKTGDGNFGNAGQPN